MIVGPHGSPLIRLPSTESQAILMIQELSIQALTFATVLNRCRGVGAPYVAGSITYPTNMTGVRLRRSRSKSMTFGQAES